MRFLGEVTVELVRHSAADSDVVWAARVSTAGEQSLETVGQDAERSRGLINYLMRDRHGSPFEHNSMTFFVHAPIMVFREFHRHRAGWCLAGDSEITLVSEGGHVRRRTIAELYRLWHHGVEDALPRSGGGVTWHQRAGKWNAQVRRANQLHYLGLHETRESAERAVAAFRTANPSTRLRKLASVRRNHVRCYDESSLLAQRARILDVMESGVKRLVRLTTASGRSLRCSADHAILTPGGWRKAGELSPGDEVMIAGTAPRPSEALIPPSLRRGLGVWTSMQRLRLIKETDTCYMCSGTFPRERLALDHVIPVAADLRRALDDGNLAPACPPCHRRKSDAEQSLAKRGGKVAVAKADSVVSVEDDGEEMTYDLSVEGPWHNFLANGIVVHNSYNEESGRYRELAPDFYVPGRERKLVQEGKPGRYQFVEGDDEQHKLVAEAMERSYRAAYAAYREMLEAGVAREVARAVLPVGLYSSMYATCNARSLMHFLSLRTKDERASVPSFPQREIEMVAEKMEAFWAGLMPLTHAAFNAAGRVAP
ncbi:FAD-dependent thymidylate synthase [Sphaerisporangium sp. NPDC005289]|uniref:FAD-dependent thymidylate synthase n=1 Tax=Sphaerisporangium sp. NPDC005289 TaxID=3155247 RepID=UPI0033B77036